MKLNNFRIRQRIHPKNVSQNTQTLQPSTIQSAILNKDELKLSSLLQSFENIITTLVSSHNHQNLSPKQTPNPSTNLTKELQYRDRFVLIELPDFSNDNVELEKLQPWIGLVCEQSLSVGFCYFLDKKINYDQMKAFASESLLRNIVNLADRYHLTPQVFRFIDQTMNNKILPFLKAKYPLATEILVNKALHGSVKQVDNSQIVSNNYFFTSDICFEYRQSGRYDDIIMTLLNELIQRTDKPSQKKSESQLSNYKQFENMMTQIFQKSFDEDWMESKNRSIGQSQVKNQKEKEKYQQKVKQYTSYLIGRKISENTPIYTQDEIKSQYLSIKSPAILRILTKWCDELWAKFQNQNYFIDRTDGLLMIGSKKIGLVYPYIKKILKAQMMNEKKEILEFMKQITDINYKQQLHILQNQIQNPDNLYLEKHQRISGKFACKNVNNVESFIVDYLNRLIHGLTKVSKQCYKSIYQFKEYWPSPYNLVTFNVSDLMRCKYSSKQKQVLRIFNEISRIADQNIQKFKIIKIKNRLKTVTNDIMIIAKFNNTINCEIQIAVNNSISQFMNCSNKINHYIYQLERSAFGPILQLCSIWKNCEKRSEMFNKLIQKEKPKRQISRIEKGECNKNIKDHELIQQKKPFICSECSKHQYHNNYFISHKKCKSCEYWKCAKCLILQNFEKQNKTFFFGEEDLNNEIVFNKDNTIIPQYGACIFINRSLIQINYYMKMENNLKEYLINEKDGKIGILREFKSRKQISEFLKECLVFKLPKQRIFQELKLDMKKGPNLVVSSLLIPQEISNSLKQYKETISILRQDNFNQVDFQKIYNENWDRLKYVESIQFSSCVLKKLSMLNTGFINLKRLNLSLNKLTDLSEVLKFKKLEKLYINENQIKSIPTAIGDLKVIKQLYLYNNRINLIPQTFSQLTQLVVLNLNNNILSEIPDSFSQLHKLKQIQMIKNRFLHLPLPLFKLKNLRSLNLSSNNIQSIPDQIQAVELRQIHLNNNKITNIPQQIDKMINLKTLDLSHNSIQTLPHSFSNLKKLQILKLQYNQLNQIQESVGGLQMLSIFNISNNKVAECNLYIFRLSQLTHLDVSLNQMVSIEDSFECLKKLKYLNISGNSITKIPDSILKIKTLKQFIFRSNPLQTFDICHLPKTNTKKLICIQNKQSLKQITCHQMPTHKNQVVQIIIFKTSIQKLPQSLFKFHNVEKISFNNNKITEIPDKFQNHLKLKNFNMNFNLLQKLPTSFSRIQSLQQLFLINNKIQQFPSVICELPKLKNLNLSENQIKSIPDSLKTLSLLEKLIINKNEIQMIPEFIGEMVVLKSLQLNTNKIKFIPQNLFNNTEMEQLLLDSNLIEVVPSGICLMTCLKSLIITNNPIKQIQNQQNLTKRFPNCVNVNQQNLQKPQQKSPQVVN